MESSFLVPKFATEAEEADWWYDNRHLVEQAFMDGLEKGTLKRGTLRRRWEELEAKRRTEEQIVLEPGDMAKAQAAAERHGMPYAAFVKKLVHEALEREDAA